MQRGICAFGAMIGLAVSVAAQVERPAPQGERPAPQEMQPVSPPPTASRPAAEPATKTGEESPVAVEAATPHAAIEVSGAPVTEPVAATGEPDPETVQPAVEAGAPPTGAGAATGGETVILSPTLGRPVFVSAGATFAVGAAGPGAGVQFRLRRGDLSFALETVNDAAAALANGRPVVVRVPGEVPAGTYDLLAGSAGDVAPDGASAASDGAGAAATARACVAVGRLPAGDGALRLVHLSDLAIGGLLGGGVDGRLAAEINLLNPAAVICTGDYVDAAAPPEPAWRELTDFFSRLDAPVILACGDRDDLATFSGQTGASPIGVVALGASRVLVLYDTPAAPLERDAEQMMWAAGQLEAAGTDGVTIVVGHAAQPGLLQALREAGDKAALERVDYWIAGGSAAWAGDGRDGASGDATDVRLVRTPAAGVTVAEGAMGTPHYRVLEIDPANGAARGVRDADAELAVGLLGVEVRRDEQQSGWRRVAAWNRHAQALNGLQATVLLPKRGEERPWCLGADLVEVRDAGSAWECRLAFALAGHSGREMLCGVGERPRVADVRVTFDESSPVPAVTLVSRTGGADGSAQTRLPVVVIENADATPVTVTPVLRLGGNVCRYRVEGEGDEAAPQARREFVLAAGQVLRLRPENQADRVAESRPALQVYVHGLAVVGPRVWVAAD